MNYNKVFFSKEIFKIVNELKIKNIIFTLDDSFNGNETIASVCLKGINAVSDEKENNKAITKLYSNENYKFIIKYEPEIVVYSNYLDSFIDDICSCLTKNNKLIEKLLKTACLENAITHEICHLNQFMTIELTTDNLDVQVDDKEETYGFVITPETKFVLEKDANNFMLSKIDNTILEDKRIKICLTNLEYNNIMININKHMMLTVKEKDGDTNPYDMAIDDHAEEVRKWFNLLDEHIKNNY